MNSRGTRIGIVAIGRNEGVRLITCLKSLSAENRPVVYVDSGSVDSSVMTARSMQATVVELDISIPFTAARARNAGFAALIATTPDVEFVQFVDGDCQICPGWIAKAEEFLSGHRGVAAICGRRRERFPTISVYNRLCDEEWEGLSGSVMSFGGDVMIRRIAFEEAGGYRDTLVAGEEPELCVRLRRKGWKIWQIEADMTFHDAAMTRFRQWWRRTARGGFAFAAVSRLHTATPGHFWRYETRRALVWGSVIPLLALGGIAVSWYSLSVLAIYPLQIIRLAPRRGIRRWHSWQSAVFMTIGKFAECQGILGYYLSRLQNRVPRLIEYKA